MAKKKSKKSTPSPSIQKELKLERHATVPLSDSHHDTQQQPHPISQKKLGFDRHAASNQETRQQNLVVCSDSTSGSRSLGEQDTVSDCSVDSGSQLQEDTDSSYDSDGSSANRSTVKVVKTQQNQDSKATGVNLYKENRAPGQGLPLRLFQNQPDVVVLEERDVYDIHTAWGFSLVGYVAGKFPGKTALLQMCDSWGVKHKYVAHNSGWLIFKFDTEEDRKQVLNGGPHFIFGRLLILKPMPQFFEFDHNEISRVPVWINLPRLPLECWNLAALGKISSKVGNPISTDGLTATKKRVSSKPLTCSVCIKLPNGKTRNQAVHYEYEPKFCSSCKIFGHFDADCKAGNKPTAREGTQTNSGRVGGNQTRSGSKLKKQEQDKPVAEVGNQSGQGSESHVQAIRKPAGNLIGNQKLSGLGTESHIQSIQESSGNRSGTSQLLKL